MNIDEIDRAGRISRWDEWFNLVGLAEEWAEMKRACAASDGGEDELVRWAHVIELTRLGTIQQRDRHNERGHY